LVVLGIEFRASHLEGRHSTTWASPPAQLPCLFWENYNIDLFWCWEENSNLSYEEVFRSFVWDPVLIISSQLDDDDLDFENACHQGLEVILVLSISFSRWFFNTGCSLFFHLWLLRSFYSRWFPSPQDLAVNDCLQKKVLESSDVGAIRIFAQVFFLSHDFTIWSY
jgi:hypothetical protein